MNAYRQGIFPQPPSGNLHPAADVNLQTLPHPGDASASSKITPTGLPRVPQRLSVATDLHVGESASKNLRFYRGEEKARPDGVDVHGMMAMLDGNFEECESNHG
jgi:hypothetical protein